MLELHGKKTCLRLAFQPGDRVTQTELYSCRKWLEVLNFGFWNKRICTIYVVKTKTLISCIVTAQLICDFVFAYANCISIYYTAEFYW